MQDNSCKNMLVTLSPTTKAQLHLEFRSAEYLCLYTEKSVADAYLFEPSILP